MAGTGGAGDAGSTAVLRDPQSFPNYRLTGSWPELETVVAQVPGTLSYVRLQVHNRFLAESCAIADYNNDGDPDVSSGRRWFEGPDFTLEHIFRDGHEDLPRDGMGVEIDTGVSDDYADFAWDIDGNGFADIINISNPDVDPARNPNPAPAPQAQASAYWYKNPGSGWETNPTWPRYPIHLDVRHEQHAFADVDGDGRPEIFGACKTCIPAETRGYYFNDWAKPPLDVWSYAPVTPTMAFPYNGTGWMHGLGFGDVNGDSLPDMLLPDGAWIQQPDGAGWKLTANKFSDGNLDPQRGGAHMYAWDIDGDGDQDVFSGDWAHGEGLAWYEQTTPGEFEKHYFMTNQGEAGTYGEVYFSQAHAAEVVDMDGDGLPDIVTGKTRFANPNGCGDPDINGTPYIYVFRTVQDEPGVSGKAHFEPYMVDDVAGVGRQIAVGHLNTDGIVDICVGTKLGLYVFFGQ